MQTNRKYRLLGLFNKVLSGQLFELSIRHTFGDSCVSLRPADQALSEFMVYSGGNSTLTHAGLLAFKVSGMYIDTHWLIDHHPMSKQDFKVVDFCS